MNNVYIAAMTKVLPPLYTAEETVNFIYSKSLSSEVINRVAQKAAKSIGIENRPIILDLSFFPERKMISEENTPLNWGKKVIDAFDKIIPKNEIGFLSTAYNITSHIDVLPNIACQIIIDEGLNLDSVPQEFAYYGCAGGAFALKAAFEYCQKSQKAAVVFVYDQCSCIANPTYDTKNADFKENMRTSLLFGDGAIGLLLVPESMKAQFSTPLMKIIDTQLGFVPGETIKMRNGNLFLEHGIKDIMPNLATEKVIRPLLERNNLTPSQIEQWAMHQGGIPILEGFKEESALQLSDTQIERSKQLFYRYGNFSAPSAFFVLESFFNESERIPNVLGTLGTFGAGQYMAAFLYQWE